MNILETHAGAKTGAEADRVLRRRSGVGLFREVVRFPISGWYDAAPLKLRGYPPARLDSLNAELDARGGSEAPANSETGDAQFSTEQRNAGLRRPARLDDRMQGRRPGPVPQKPGQPDQAQALMPAPRRQLSPPRIDLIAPRAGAPAAPRPSKAAPHPSKPAAHSLNAVRRIDFGRPAGLSVPSHGQIAKPRIEITPLSSGFCAPWTFLQSTF